MRFQDKVTLISGAASGFGRLAAERFAAEGARLVLTDVDADGLASAAEAAGGAMTTVMDVTDEAAHESLIAAILARHGRLDIALNNAGILAPLAPIEKTSTDDFDRMMAVNARGVFLAMKHQIPPMVAAGGGTILNTASVAGLIGAGRFSAYVASKHAVVGLTKSAADEHARNNIRINAICPAFSVSPMLEGIAEQLKPGAPVGQTYDSLAAGIPMRRVATTDEIVSAMMLICDPSNTFMTGQSIAIDGGLTAI